MGLFGKSGAPVSSTSPNTGDRPSGASSGTPSDSAAPAVKRATPAAKPFVALPVCGILTTPFPCIVTKSGARVFEGAEIGGSTILKIEADSVTLTNSMGRFSWKP